MQQLDLLYNIRPNAAFIALELLNIRDITTFLPRLKQFKYLDSISLHGNKLTYLPNLQILSDIVELDLSKNPMKIDNKLMDSLFPMAKLESLNIDIHTQEQRQIILQNLPKLKILNGKEIIRKKEIQNPKEKQIQIIKQKLYIEQNNAKNLLNNIYNMLDQNIAPPDTNEDFSFSLKCIVQEFEYFYQNINSNLARQCVYLYSKNKLYQVVDTNLSTFLEDNGHQNIATAIDQINKSKKENFEDILKVALSYAYSEDYSIKTVQPTNKLRKQTLYQNEITRLKKQVSDLMKQNQELHQASQKYLEKIYNAGKSGKSMGTKHNQNQSKIVKSNAGSNLHTPMSRSSSKNGFARTPSKLVVQAEPSRSPSKSNLSQSSLKREGYRQIDKSPSYKVLPKARQAQVQFVNLQKKNSLASLSVRHLKPNSSTRSIQKQSNPNEQQVRKSQSNQKKLTLDQMVQFIDDFIYEKGKFNIQCYSKGQLFQTPQQFLYTYFLRKYGLKDMALEWSLLTIKAIEKFSKENIIVQVFGKILKNTLEEEFYASCKDFRQYLNSFVPLMQTLDSSDVQSIFYSLFPEEDQEKYEKFLTKLKHETVKGVKVYRRRPMIFRLEEYYVKLHQKQIQKYLIHFKTHDKDQDGIIEGDEIQKCIASFIKKHAQFLTMYQSQENMQDLYEEIIKKRRKKGNMVSMTFSQFYSIMRHYF